MKRGLFTSAGLFVVVSFLPGCRAAEGQGLPPPTGSGSPVAPEIPKLSDVGSAAPVSSSTAGSAWTGSLFARHDASLGPKASGILSQITVEEGDHVKKGQLLFRLDPAQAGLGVSQAKAAVASAEVGYDAAKLELSRSTELSKNGSIAPAAYDQSKTGFDRAVAARDQARVALQVAERGAADTSIYSPIDGVVTAKLKSVGETATMTPPTVVLVIQDVDRLELRAHVPENALSTLTTGSPIRMTVTSVGIVREVLVKRINPTIDPRTRTVEVIADVDNTDGKLKVGMLVEVAFGANGAGGASGAAPGSASAQGAKAP